MIASTSGQLNNPITLNLVSGLFGSIIGAGATVWATHSAIKKTANESLKLEKQKREWEQRDQRKQNDDQVRRACFSLYYETRENLKTIEMWRSYRRKFKFASDAWETAKPLLHHLPESLRNELVVAYSQLRRHNTTIDYDLQVPYGLGSMDAEIERQIIETNKSLESLRVELEKFLDITADIKIQE